MVPGLGLIKPVEYKNITLIRKMRNYCAHHPGDVSFSTPQIADRVRELDIDDDAQFRKFVDALPAMSSEAQEEVDTLMPRARLSYTVGTVLSAASFVAAAAAFFRLEPTDGWLFNALQSAHDTLGKIR